MIFKLGEPSALITSHATALCGLRSLTSSFHFKICFVAAVAEDDWPSHIESIKDVWPPFVSSATHLAAESTEFAAEMKRVKSLWSEEGADKAGADVSSQLQDLRTAVFGQL